MIAAAGRSGLRIHALTVRCLLLCCLAAFAGCVATTSQRDPAACTSRLAAFETLVDARNITLSEPRAVPGYPALASNRLLASFDPQRLSAREREAWIGRLLEAGRERRDLLRQMLDDQPEPLPGEAGSAAFHAALDRCAAADAVALSRDLEDLQSLHAAAQIADDYLTSRRVFGLYPLTALAVKAGARQLRREIHAEFAMPRSQLPVAGKLQRYAPLDAIPEDAASKLPVDILGPLTVASPALEALFARHAPVWEIDTVGGYDRPGRPYLPRPGEPRVDSAEPVVFRYASLTRFAGALRLQLNYLLWFDQRPASGALDSLAGRLDGLQWRVTLDERGAPLLYDSVHPCGCYHLLFPDHRLQLRDDALTLPEPPLVPQQAPTLAKSERLVLRVSSGEHFIQRVYSTRIDAVDSASRRYALEPYRALYSTPGAEGPPAGPGSLFDRHGIVAGTERGERFYLWPMGIRAPGAMRERGRQATAFVGRRHFDDAYLLEQFFRLQD